MPHAALWVVQLGSVAFLFQRVQRFNAARGFVGGAAESSQNSEDDGQCFNAARGFVGGAASPASPDFRG